MLAANLLAGCAPPKPEALRLMADFEGAPVMGAFRASAAGAETAPLWVLIEGDGAAWQNGLPPRDPTPRRSLPDRLEGGVPADVAVLYLARPCQYAPGGQMPPACNARFWTTDRFTPALVTQYDRLITAHLAPGQRPVLIGYSGGGVLAAALAARRGDTAGLITLAAPIDLARWTKVHAIAPLSGPAPMPEILTGIARIRGPVLLLFGSEDRIVPPAAVDGLRRKLPDRVRILPGIGHDADWGRLLQTLPDFPV